MRSVRKIMIASMVFTIIVMGVVMYFMFMGPDRLIFEGKSLQELFKGGELFGVIFVPIMVVVTIVILWSVLRSVAPAAIKNGVTASARVLEVRDTGVTLNDNPQVALTLEIRPKDQAIFQAEVKTIISRLNVALVQPGTEVQVVFDPNNLKRIQVSEINLDSTLRSDAESRLRELEHLYDQRLITGDEYRTKREEILKKI